MRWHPLHKWGIRNVRFAQCWTVVGLFPWNPKCSRQEWITDIESNLCAIFWKQSSTLCLNTASDRKLTTLETAIQSKQGSVHLAKDWLLHPNCHPLVWSLNTWKPFIGAHDHRVLHPFCPGLRTIPGHGYFELKAQNRISHRQPKFAERMCSATCQLRPEQSKAWAKKKAGRRGPLGDLSLHRPSISAADSVVSSASSCRRHTVSSGDADEGRVSGMYQGDWWPGATIKIKWLDFFVEMIVL